MKANICFSVCALGLNLLFTACKAEDAVGASGASFMLATVEEGDIETRFEGTGKFDLGRDPERGVSIFFIDSWGTGATTGDRIIFANRGSGRLRPGTYVIGSFDGWSSATEGLTASYYRANGEDARQYIADTGQLIISSVTKNQIEGSFQFEALPKCPPEVAESSHFTRDSCSSGSAGVAVSGEFVATLETYAGIVTGPKR